MPTHKHFVWATRDRYPFLDTADFRCRLWEHIVENANAKGIDILAIGGYQDHCHCLVRVKADQSDGWIAQMMKGESANWINKQRLTPTRFSWQRRYWVKIVPRAKVDKIIDYINNQEEHHSQSRVLEEWEVT